MNRSTVNMVLDAALLLLIAAVISTGLILGYILLPGSGGLGHGRGAAQALLLWGQSRHEWGTVHLWLALSMIGLAVVHLWLHWRWLWSMIARPHAGITPRQRRLRLIVAGLSAVMVVAVIATPWLVPVEQRDEVSAGEAHSGRGGNRWAPD